MDKIASFGLCFLLLLFLVGSDGSVWPLVVLAKAEFVEVHRPSSVVCGFVSGSALVSRCRSGGGRPSFGFVLDWSGLLFVEGACCFSDLGREALFGLLLIGVKKEMPIWLASGFGKFWVRPGGARRPFGDGVGLLSWSNWRWNRESGLVQLCYFFGTSIAWWPDYGEGGTTTHAFGMAFPLDMVNVDWELSAVLEVDFLDSVSNGGDGVLRQVGASGPSWWQTTRGSDGRQLLGSAQFWSAWARAFLWSWAFWLGLLFNAAKFG